MHTKFSLRKVTKIRGIRQSRVPQLGKLLRNILDYEDTKRVGAKGLLEGLKGDVS